MFHTPEKYRVITGNQATTKASGNSGVFHVPLRHDKLSLSQKLGTKLFGDVYGYAQCMISDKFGWEKVSVVIISPNKKEVVQRDPTWKEMKQVWGKFWDPTDIIVQFHFDESKLATNIPNVLTMWRKIGSIYELPAR